MKIYGNKKYPLINYSSNQLWVQLQYLITKLKTPSKLPNNNNLNKWSSIKYAEFNKLAVKPKKSNIIAEINKTLTEIPIKRKTGFFQKFNQTSKLCLQTPLPDSPPSSPSKIQTSDDIPTLSYVQAVTAGPSSTPRFETQETSKGLKLLLNNLTKVQQMLSVNLAEFDFLRNSKRTSSDINVRIKTAESLVVWKPQPWDKETCILNIISECESESRYFRYRYSDFSKIFSAFEL